MGIKIIICVLLLFPVALFALAFGILNVQIVEVDLLFVSFSEIKLGLGLAVAFLLGALIGAVAASLPSLIKSYKIKKLQHKMSTMEKELEKFRQNSQAE